jgi:hypothetical protein
MKSIEKKVGLKIVVVLARSDPSLLGAAVGSRSDPARQRSCPQVGLGIKKVHLGIKTGAFYGQEATMPARCVLWSRSDHAREVRFMVKKPQALRNGVFWLTAWSLELCSRYLHKQSPQFGCKPSRHRNSDHVAEISQEFSAMVLIQMRSVTTLSSLSGSCIS